MSADAADIVDYETNAPTRFGDDLGMFRSVFERSGMCVAHLNRSLRIVAANADFLRRFDRTPAEVSGLDFGALLHPSVRDKLALQFTRLVDNQRLRFADRLVAPRTGGATLAGELTAFAVDNAAGAVESIVVLLRPDIGGGDGQLVSACTKVLTGMESRILEGVAAGASTVQLAVSLYLSRGGVEYHVTTLLRKMKVQNRSALVSKAYSMGLFGVGSWPPRVLPEFVKS
ncbi:helix-turn-helix transcriptional regulator [Kibdelosporangium aridum]|uniref:helix-turn-helix transcriptional regulator n=1 Tax=Kibdelosporangium aridum TaxID=2030 RepID=UPI000689E233